MNVLTKGQQESKPKTSQSYEVPQHLINYYMMRRKQLVEEGRHIEKLLIEQGVITKRYILLRNTN